MEYPFKIIESKTTDRKRFQVEDGVQPTHALFYIKEGEFEMTIDNKRVMIGAGDCVILPDYVRFRRSITTPIVFVYVKFEYNFNCRFSFELPYGKIEFEDKARFLTNIQNIEKLSNASDSKSACFREHYFMDILLALHFEKYRHTLNGSKAAFSDKTIERAAEWIEKNADKKILISDVCRALGTNASTLNFRFRRETETSVGQFITKVRMQKAAKLLTGSTYSVSDISERCGYDNVYYFSNAFKKFYGISPKQYRDN